MHRDWDWIMIALFCVTVIAGAAVGAAMRSGMSSVQTIDTVYLATAANTLRP